ncbi:MAG: GGDEF domain-containing protein [Betaproteobacteria bacterium]|nr:GGDEF domain-containing protein [Betaproteobacteria bacterium]
MHLDIRTLFLVAVMTMTLLGLVSLTFASLRPGNPAIRLWGASLLVLAGGLVLIVLRGVIPDVLSVVVGNMVTVAAIVLGYRSLRMLRAQPLRDYLGWVLVLAITASAAFYLYVEPNITLRVVFFSAVAAFLLFRNAWLLGHDAPSDARASHRITAGIFGFFGAVHALRSAAVWVIGRPEDLMAPHLPDAVLMLVTMAAIICATLGLLWLEVRRLQHDLAHLASIDQLTGALTRRAFSSEFAREVSRRERDKGSFGLAMFDIDHFKRINDEHGHLVGDELLRAIADSLRQGLRAHDVLCRYGGEEFVVLMPGADKAAATAVADRARRSIEHRGWITDKSGIVITVSAGVSAYPEDGRDWDALIGAADAALYTAKRRGRNCVVAAAADPSSALSA